MLSFSRENETWDSGGSMGHDARTHTAPRPHRPNSEGQTFAVMHSLKVTYLLFMSSVEVRWLSNMI